MPASLARAYYRRDDDSRGTRGEESGSRGVVVASPNGAAETATALKNGNRAYRDETGRRRCPPARHTRLAVLPDGPARLHTSPWSSA